MPALELAQETGKLVSWLKQEGQTVAKGEPLLEIETDKAVMEIESPGDGVLTAIRVQPGVEVPVGQTIAWLLRPGEPPPLEDAPSESGRRMTAASPTSSSIASQAAASPADAPAKISPKARRLAKEHGIDLSRMRGSGPGGEILATDILAVVEAGTAPAQTAPAQPGLETMSSTAKLMAERTTKSWTSVPHFFVVHDVDASALLAARERLLPEVDKAFGVRLTHTDLLAALVAPVLARHPRANAAWTDQGIRLNQQVNLGIAMAVEDAVVAAVIPNADTTALGQIAVQRRDMAERARAGRLRSSDIAGATFTISNLGMYNVDAFNAIISPPQVAILAVGRIADRVVPVDGKPAIRPMMTLTLSADHRVIDGARAAMFLHDVAEAIRQPETSLGRR
jgi:pyruvate dehydrogenase E2 component (dihydrolipoamide acetyltransferase)